MIINLMNLLSSGLLLLYLDIPEISAGHISIKNGPHIPESHEVHENRLQPLVRVEQGLLRGQKVESAAGGFYYSFQGIPYARPPLGPLRFKDAESPERWEGVRQGFALGNLCPQPNYNLDDGIIGDEDCLYLNVYTPRLPTKVHEPLPVMVWLHGGGFAVGAGYNDTYPDYLVSEDIIVVTLNYRLSALGFLYLNEAAPGNVGMKDQVAALRWVQRNIAAFGGNAANVTIVGQSAGGFSVHLHMLSPMTKGLFHGGIALSGNALNQWGIPRDPLEVSRRLAQAVGCPVHDDSETVECLRRVDAQKLIDAAFRNSTLEADQQRLGAYTFVPTVDLAVRGVERFLPAPAFDLVSAGRHHPLPFMTGFNDNESLAVATEAVNFLDPAVGQRVDRSWAAALLPELRLPEASNNNQSALQRLRDFYMDGQPLSSATMRGFTEMLTDIYTAEGIYYTLRNMAKYKRAPLYSYSFEIDGPLNYAKVKTSTTNLIGAEHGDEMGYLFRSEILPTVAIHSPAWTDRARMVRLWTNFVKFGDPTPIVDPLLKVKWEQYTNEKRNFLEVGSRLRPGLDHNAKRVEFWERFYEPHS